ncbi:hypothetical protein ACFPIJ_22595 [Dactylosporangium cerinum]|uniref:Uncharacterized protein n=1 Tax=Dactylosporangium cerinum TaxID=1434730 RepID=A0ABV9VWC4_9ACTN
MRSAVPAGRRFRWSAGAALTVVSIVTALAATAAPAWAHNALRSSNPAEGASLPTSPTAITA